MAESSGGTPVSGVTVYLAQGSSDRQAVTNSSGEVIFGGLTYGLTYQVSASVDGVHLGAPITMYGNGVIVLEPNSATAQGGSSSSSQTATKSVSSSLTTSRSGGTGSSRGGLALSTYDFLGIGIVAAVLVIIGSYIELVRRRAGTAGV